MKYKILFAILIFTLIFGTSVNGDAKISLDFEEALDLALKNSLDLKSKDRAIGKAYDTFEKQYDSSPLVIEHKNSDFRKFITGQVDPYIKAEEAYYKYKQAILERDNLKISIANNLRTAILAVDKAEKAAKEANENKKSWENELVLIKLRFDNHLMDKTEYLDKKAELEKKIKETEKTKKNLEDAYYSLNTMLDRQNEQDIIVNMKTDIIPLAKLDLEQIKKDNLTKDLNLIQKKNNRYVKKLYYEFVDEETSHYNFDRLNDKTKDYILETYDEAKDSYETADIEYEKALNSFNKEFDDAIQSLSDSYELIEEAIVELEEETLKAKHYEVKYNARLISKKEYDNKVLSLKSLKDNLESLQMDYYQKLMKVLAYSDIKP